MARNFGVPRQIDRHERAALWPMWVVAFSMSVINAVRFCTAADAQGSAPLSEIRILRR
jgi:hypothetical protein